MKKKVIVWFFISIVVLYIFNMNFFVWNFFLLLANRNYDNKDYKWAYELYEKSKTFLTWSNIEYNLWNTYFKLWEQQTQTWEKIEYYKKSLEKYVKVIQDNSGTLNRESDVVFNYLYVSKKMEELSVDENSKNEEEKKDSETSSEWQNKNEEEKKEEEKKEEDKKNSETSTEWQKETGSEWQNKREDTTWENQQEIKLTDEELKQIDDYLNAITNEQNSLRQYYWTIDIDNIKTPFYQVDVNSNDKDW